MSDLDAVNRRDFLKTVGMGAATAGMAMPYAALGENGVAFEVVEPGQAAVAAAKAKDTIKFAVCGASHDHIYGMVGAIQRGGGTLVAWTAEEADKTALFKSRFPEVKQARSEAEILDDPTIQLVLSSTVASRRAPLGVRVMRRGKDFLSDKPGITTLEQLAEVRKAMAETGRIYGIMYSELLEVKAAIKAGELVRAGAIGKVIQTINIAPHQVTQNPTDRTGGGAQPRPDWFWVPELYGGILTDIGSHQVDQFLYYTGSSSAEIVESQIANFKHPEHPEFQDFGDMVLRGDKGLGYVRLDWYTPNGLGTWGDGRLFILGTQGYIECRKYTNVGVSKAGNNLFLVDKDSARYMDCNQVPLPFGPQFVSDVVNRTHVAQDQTQALLAAELVIRAQMGAKRVTIG